MGDDTIADLKQAIAATVHQETAELEEHFSDKIDAKVDQLDKRLSSKIDNLSQSVAGEQSRDDERRITVLEHKLAAW